MIIDSLEKADKYASLNPLFAKAFAYLHSVDLATLKQAGSILMVMTWLAIVAAKRNDRCRGIAF